jgi:Dolichyl-phosphate-mannose-protein mannosyltransferase
MWTATKPAPVNRKQIALLCLLLLCIAIGVRLLSRQDNRFDVTKVEWGVTVEYKEAAQTLLRGEYSDYLHNLFFMTHPPGYGLLLALIYKFIGNSDRAIQMVQIVCDSIAVVFVFLIVAGLLSQTAGVIAALLVAVSPQLAYYPSLLLPDSICVLPLLVAIYCLVLAYRRPRIFLFLIAGAGVGISCWLRANALLLAPFLAATIPILFTRGKRLQYAAALVLGSILPIIPITIKNYVVFHQFIPLSLGSGQKLLEGIAEYDKAESLGVPKTDAGIVRQEAEMFQRPDYLGGLFSGDGIERDRMRVKRGWSVIRAHKLWYLGVMSRRAVSFLRLARTPLVSIRPPNSHPLDTNATRLAGTLTPEFLAGESDATKLGPDHQSVMVSGAESRNGIQIGTSPISVKEDTDYLLQMPLHLESGRLLVTIAALNGRVLYETIVDIPEVITATEPMQKLDLPFATGEARQVNLIVSNAGADSREIIGPVAMFEQGPTAYRWTRYPRLLVHLIQLPFITACMLPLTLLGIALLVRRREWPALALLLVVPAYFLCFQSTLHTERRYIIAIHYFLFALAAVPLAYLIEKVTTRLDRKTRPG